MSRLARNLRIWLLVVHAAEPFQFLPWTGTEGSYGRGISMRLLTCTFGRASRTRQTPPSSEGNHFSLTERRYGYGWGDRQVLSDSHDRDSCATSVETCRDGSHLESDCAEEWVTRGLGPVADFRTNDLPDGRTPARQGALRRTGSNHPPESSSVLPGVWPTVGGRGDVQCQILSILFGQSLTTPKEDGALRKYGSPDVTTPLPPQKSLRAW